MIIKSKNKKIPKQVNSVNLLIQLIEDFNLINNLVDVPTFMRTHLSKIMQDEYTFTELKRKLNHLFESKTQLNVNYWYCRGWKNPNDKVIELQRTRSKLCVEYWINRGYDMKNARDKISELQHKHSNTSNNVSNKQLRERSHRCIEYWLKRGFNYEDAKLKVKSVNDNSSLEYFTNKFGKVDGYLKYKQNCELHANFGESNPQYGKSSPYGSGNGISGYYKYYYFRSLYEYFAIKKFENDLIQFKPNDVSIHKDSNKVVISYNYKGTLRKYIPDFIIHENEIVEIKPKYQLKNELTKHKIEAANLFVKKSNFFKNYNAKKSQLDNLMKSWEELQLEIEKK